MHLLVGVGAKSSFAFREGANQNCYTVVAGAVFGPHNDGYEQLRAVFFDKMLFQLVEEQGSPLLITMIWGSNITLATTM